MTTIPDVSPELPSRTWRLILRALQRLPQGALSRSFGRVADVPIPPRLRQPVLGAFVRATGIDMKEAERPLESYRSINDLFVRRLRQDARSWPDDPGQLASPVDGIVGRFGSIEQGMLVQAKGHRYTVAELIGSEEEAAGFEGGEFITIYLSPRHYHRIHTPIAGEITLARHLPGLLLPVNEPAVMHVPRLFARNERLHCLLETGRGLVGVIAVGAYNVGRISAAFDPAWNAAPGRGSWVTNRRQVATETHRYDPPVPLETGAEMMAFHLGSTVILLLEAGRLRLRGDLASGMAVRLGEMLAA